MARRNKRTVDVATGTLVVLTIAVGLPVNVVSDYLPPVVTDYHAAWIAGLVVVSLVAVWLTWLGPRLAERRSSGVLFQVQPMPEGWVPRDELDVVVRALIGAGGGAVGVTTALLGAGGFGKTSLAVAACHDRQVRKYFSGGILWATIGKDRTSAESTDLIGSICAAVSGERPQMTDVKQLSHHLANLLSERGRMLLVVDDVWTGAQLEPFLAVAERSRLLITTRRPRTLPGGVIKVEVDAMMPAVARQLLGRNLPAIRPDLHRQLLEMTGGWPLLLALVNARLVEDVEQSAEVNAAAEQAVDRLRQAGPTALDITDSGQRETAVKTTIDSSLDVLDAGKRERFLELGIFAEDVDVPLETVALLWRGTAGLSAERSQQLCEELAGLSLMSLRWAGGVKRVMSLHDVVRAFTRSEHGLGSDRRVMANRALIKEARSLILGDAGDDESDEGQAWWRLPAGHFLWDYLAYHMSEGQCDAELGRLMADVRWALVRLDHAGLLALETDLAWCESAESADTRRLIARVGHLLGELESPALSRRNRLTHLSVLPHLRDQIEYLCRLDDLVLLPLLPMPESHDSAPIRTLASHTCSVNAVAIAPDGSWLASASNDGTVRIWNADGTLRTTLTSNSGSVNAVAIAPDGSWLASASNDGTVHIWNADGTLRTVLSGHTKPVKAVAIAPDGSWLASASNDQTVRIWNADGTLRTTLTDHLGPANAVAIAPDGSWLASASYGRVHIWNADGALRTTLTDHTGSVNAVAIAPDGSWLASASNDRTVRIWNAEGTLRTTLTDHLGPVRTVAIAPDGSWLASASNDGTVRTWNIDGALRTTLTDYTRPVKVVAIAPDGSWLASASSDGKVRLWSTDSKLPTVVTGHTDWVRATAIASNGSWLASASNDQTVRIWNADGTLRSTLTDHTGSVNAVAIAPDGSWLASASNDGTVRIWNADGTLRTTLTDHLGPVRTVAIAPDGSWLASASYGRVHIWNADGILRTALTVPSGSMNAVAIAPDGSWLASASNKGVHIWNIDGTLRTALTNHTDSVNAVAIAPDGSWLASASNDGTVRIWGTGEDESCSTAMRCGAAILSVCWGEPNTVIASGAYGIYMIKVPVPASRPQVMPTSGHRLRG